MNSPQLILFAVATPAPAPLLTGSPTDWIALTLVGTALVAAVAAVVGILVQSRSLRHQIATSNMWRLIDEWWSTDMRQLRARLSARLWDHPNERAKLNSDAIEVLNTFELLGYLAVKSKTLHIEHVWTNFSPWAIPWWHIFEGAIVKDRLQVGDNTMFEDFEALIGRLAKHEMRVRDLSEAEVVPDEKILRRFLDSERKLRQTPPLPARVGPSGVFQAAIQWLSGIPPRRLR